MGRRSELSDCELITMKCLWDLGEPSTCPEIMEKLRDEFNLNYKDTTVYTFLKNLIAKGFVKARRRGVTFYSAARSEDEFRDSQLSQSIDFWYDGSAAKLVSAVVRLDSVDDDELGEIKKILDGYDK